MIEPTQIVYASISSIAVLSLLLRKRTRTQYAKGLKMALLWVAIVAVVFAGIVYWPEFKDSKLYNSLVAGSAMTGEGGSMEFSRSADGHFHINAMVNDVQIGFMVDTGAADITLTQADAKRIGFYPDELKFDKLYSTANGMTRCASVKLKNIAIGNYQTGEIYASVNEGEMDVSLLGMSFLNKMKSYRIEGDRLILQP